MSQNIESAPILSYWHMPSGVLCKIQPQCWTHTSREQGWKMAETLVPMPWIRCQPCAFCRWWHRRWWHCTFHCYTDPQGSQWLGREQINAQSSKHNETFANTHRTKANMSLYIQYIYIYIHINMSSLTYKFSMIWMLFFFRNIWCPQLQSQIEAVSNYYCQSPTFALLAHDYWVLAVCVILQATNLGTLLCVHLQVWGSANTRGLLRIHWFLRVWKSQNNDHKHPYTIEIPNKLP